MAVRVLPLAFAALLAAALVAGCAGRPGDDATPTPRSPAVALDGDGFVDRRVGTPVHFATTFPSPVGGRIHVEYYLPADAGPDDRFPVLLTVTPYESTESAQGVPLRLTTGFDLADMVSRGYAVAFADARGFGGSDGCWDYYGDDEMADAVASVDWVATQPWSAGKVGMFGLSYPGTTQLLAAIGQPAPLATIVPVAPEPDVYENQYKNGLPYRNLLTSSFTYATVYPAIATAPSVGDPAAPGWATSIPEDVRCFPDSTVGLNDPDNNKNAFYQERDRQGDAAAIRVPVLWSHGFWDQNVKPDVVLPMLGQIETPVKAWLWQGFHAVPTEAVSGRTGWELAVHRWYDHWLYGVDNGIDHEVGYDVQDSLGRWRHEDAWPPLDAVPTKLWLAPDGRLGSEGVPLAGTASFGTQQATDLEYGCFMPDAFLQFRTAGFPAPVHVAGVPILHLRLRADQSHANVVVGLYDVDDQAHWTLLDRAALDLRHRSSLEQARDVTDETMDVTFDAWPTDWVFAQGHHVGLVVAGSDQRFIVASAANLELEFGAGSYLTLPVIPERTAFLATTTSDVMGQRTALAAPGTDPEGCATAPANYVVAGLRANGVPVAQPNA